MLFKQHGTDIKELDPAKGIVEAYANVYHNVDSDNDISAPGSFTKTVKDNFKRIRVLLNHNSTLSLGVSKSLDANDAYGLKTVTQFNMNKNLSKDMFTDIQLAMDNGQNAELSIGYDPLVRDQKDKRIITEYKLYEYSFLTSWAANDLAIATGVKSSTYYIDLLSKAYNLPYSDQRLTQIETILKSLTKEPGNDTILKVEPINPLNIFSI